VAERHATATNSATGTNGTEQQHGATDRFQDRRLRPLGHPPGVSVPGRRGPGSTQAACTAAEPSTRTVRTACPDSSGPTYVVLFHYPSGEVVLVCLWATGGWLPAGNERVASEGHDRRRSPGDPRVSWSRVRGAVSPDGGAESRT
jgi:hypothetical protein